MTGPDSRALIVPNPAAIVSPCAVASDNKVTHERRKTATGSPAKYLPAENAAPLAPSSPIHRSESEEASEQPGERVHPEDNPSLPPSTAAHLRESPQITPPGQHNLDLRTTAGTDQVSSSQNDGLGDDDDNMQVDRLPDGKHPNDEYEDLQDDFHENNAGDNGGDQEKNPCVDHHDDMQVDSDPINLRPARAKKRRRVVLSPEADEEELDVSPASCEVIDVDLYVSIWEPTKNKVSIFPSSFSALIVADQGGGGRHRS